MRRKNRQENLERDKETMRQHYHKNKEAIKLYKSQIFACECGSECTLAHKARHFQSKKHQDWAKQQEEK